MPSAKRKAQPSPPPARMPLDRRLLYAILIIYLLLAFGYARVTPFGQAPDESAHFVYVRHIGDGHGLPMFDSQAPGAGYEFHQPPLYYVLAAPFYLLTREADPGATILAVRALNIWLNCLLIWLSFLFAQALFPKRPRVRLACAAFVAFLSMQASISASITNDLLADVLFAALLWQAVARWPQGWRNRDSVLLGVFAGLGLLTKNTCFILLPLGWLAALLYFTRERQADWRGLMRAGAIITMTALAIGGWWLVRNQVLYGDPVAWSAFLRGFRGSPHPQDLAVHSPWFSGGEFSWLIYWRVVARWTYQSSWGVFGNMDLFLPGWVYWALAVVPLGVTVGLIRLWQRRAEWLEPWQRQALTLCLITAAIIWAMYLRFNVYFFQAQARYLFVVLPVGALLAALGFERLAPARCQRYLVFVPAVLALVVNVLALFVWAGPALLQR